MFLDQITAVVELNKNDKCKFRNKIQKIGSCCVVVGFMFPRRSKTTLSMRFYTITHTIHIMKLKKIKVVKCVKQPYEQQSLLVTLFAYFHWAVNESIGIGIEKNLTSTKAMNREIYGYLQTGLKATYAQTAYEMALAMLKAHRKLRRKGKNSKIPYMRRDCIKITNQNYKIKNG